MPESDLIRRTQAGDQAAFAQLFAAHRERAFRTACLITQDRSLAEDMTQEAFVRAYLHISRCDPDRPFLPWLLRILINLCRNAVKRRGRSVQVAAMDLAVGDTTAAVDDREMLWQALLRLEPRHRDVLMLRYYHDLSDVEIAEALAIPAGTVKSRLHSARGLLARLVGGAAL